MKRKAEAQIDSSKTASKKSKTGMLCPGPSIIAFDSC